MTMASSSEQQHPDQIKCRIQYINDIDPFGAAAAGLNREPLKPAQCTLHLLRPIGEQLPELLRLLRAPHKSGDCCLQVSSASGEFTSYLDSELSLSEQPDELYTLQNDPLHSGLLLRQQPALRVKAIIDKLLYTSGRDQRRALFSLKALFQEDKDLVHEFVQNGGLEALIRLGRNSDQNHQNHILRALGQLMLYVDGMNGVIALNDTVCWLYELLDSALYDHHLFSELSSSRVEWYRLVVKTALKLLLVFVEYTESNSLLFLAAISRVERAKNRPDWFSLMRILNNVQASDQETLIFGITVINKTLHGVPDQDTFFDVIDCLESQGIDKALHVMASLNNAQLGQQCALFEQELRKEDAALDSDTSSLGGGTQNRMQQQSQQNVAKMRLNGTGGNAAATDRRNTMRKRQQEQEELQMQQNAMKLFNKIDTQSQQQQQPQRISALEAKKQQQPKVNGFNSSNNNAANETAKEPSKRRLEMNASLDEIADKFERALQIEQQQQQQSKGPAPLKLMPTDNEKENIGNGTVAEHENESTENSKPVKAPPPMIPTNIFSPTDKKTMDFPEPIVTQPKKEPTPPPETIKPKKVIIEDEDSGGGGDGFAAMLAKRANKMQSGSTLKKITEAKVSESEQKWKEAGENLKDKPMIINDLDFSDFVEFEQDPLVLARMAQMAQEKGLLPGGASSGDSGGGVPPPPPPMFGNSPLPPPPPPGPAVGNGAAHRGREQSPGPSSKNAVVKLHWKEAQHEAPPVPALKRKGTFWSKVEPPQIDTSKLAKLFEQKPKEVVVKKTGADTKPQLLQVLSMKRSQAINIGLTKLPPVTVIPSAIRKFDSTVLNKEGIEKILTTMMPSLEEIERIQIAQAENPETPLGQAEQFLLSLSEIDCLLERLRLWLFMQDYQNVEKEVAEALMEWNNAMKQIEECKTFRVAMGMLLTIGNALNGTDIKAFQLDYLSRASEVKDPVHKYPLTHHLADYMIDNYPEGSDLYSDLGAVSRSSRLDFDSVFDNLKKMETDCKNCFDYVAKISQKDNSSSMKNKVNSFLTEVAERVHRLKHVQRTTTHRWNAFLLYFGYAPGEVKDQKPLNVFKMVIEFALEYRTARDKILQTRKRLQEKRERNKTRGMMIGAAQNAATTTGMLQKKQQKIGLKSTELMTDKERHQEMSRLLTGGPVTNGDETLMRKRIGPAASDRIRIAAQTEAMRNAGAQNGGTIGGDDDELLDGVVRTVTAQTDPRDASRRRAKIFNRKSFRRTRTIHQEQLVELNSNPQIGI